jgi:hypothetical protein
MTCENCGLPTGALVGPGTTLKITRKAENKFKRDSQANVWCCSEECAVQQFGISKYGPATHRWGLTLNQVRGQYRRQHAPAN